MALAEANMMNGHGHVEPVTRAWDARLSRIERRLAELTKSGEQRVRVLRDALAEFISDEMAERDDEIASLKKHIADLERQLEQKITIDKLVNEAVTRLDARQVARGEAKRGKIGRQGERGARGERGPPGARGPAALPGQACARDPQLASIARSIALRHFWIMESHCRSWICGLCLKLSFLKQTSESSHDGEPACFSRQRLAARA